MDSSKQNMVVFCGAGFSAPLGIPTMARFADALRDSAFLSPAEQQEFNRIQLECNQLASVIGTSARDLEQLASFLSVLEISRPSFRFGGCTLFPDAKSALRLVTKCIRHLAKPDLITGPAQSSRGIIDFCDRVNLTFVTTNYDLHIELAGAVAGKLARPSPTILAARASLEGYAQRTMYSDSGRFRIFKLHGSINWFDSGGGLAVEDRLCEDTRYARGEGGYWERTGALPDGDAFLRRDDAIIVPPTIIKPSLMSQLSEQWIGACEAIASADILWFIGYSFPESDSFMRYLLGSALFQNLRVRQIAVINPDLEVIERRARPLFDAPHHREVFCAIPLGWKDAPLERVFSGSLDSLLDERQVKAMELKRRSAVLLSGGLLRSWDEEIEHAGIRSRSRGRGR